MDFGIALSGTVDSWRVVARAEALGFTQAWFYDAPLLTPDLFVCMALAATHSTRIRLGTGVVVPGNRSAVATANCLATLNKLAPGRIDFGVGTGFASRRTLGMPPVPLAEVERFTAEVVGLLQGETIDVQVAGTSRKARFLNPELGLVDLTAPVGLHVSALGPTARRLAARLGAGWIDFSGNTAEAIASLTDMQMSWANRGRIAEDLYATLFTVGCVLRSGERLTSDRVMAQAGPYAAVLLHDLVETTAAGELDAVLPPEVVGAVEGYRAVYSRYAPADARHLALHRGHLLFVKPEERPFVTKTLLETFTFTGKPRLLTERIAELRDAGFRQFTVQLMHGQETALDEWANVLAPLGLGAPSATSKPAGRRTTKSARSAPS